MKKSMLLLLVTVISTFALIGCASTGNQSLAQETEHTVKQKIVVGKTTKAEVKQMFGSPVSTTFTDNGSEIWNYQLNDVQADGVNFIPIVGAFGQSYSGTQKTLVILWNENGTVKKFSMNESAVNTKSGVFK